MCDCPAGYVMLPTLDGNVHVIPAIVLKQIVYGEREILDIDDSNVIIRSIIFEWLDTMEKTGD